MKPADERHSGPEPNDEFLERTPGSEFRLRQRVTIAVGSAMVLTALLGLLSSQLSRLAAEDSDRVDRTYQASRRLQLTLRHADDVQTGVRGFAMTGADQFLEPYESGKKGLERDRDQLAILIADSPDQQRRLVTLNGLVEDRLRAAARMIAARRTSGKDPTLAELLPDKQVMDAMRLTVHDMDAEEGTLLVERSQRSRRRWHFTSSAIGLGSFLGVIFLSAAGVVLWRGIGVTGRALAQVNVLNAHLELRVQQRTAALEAEALARRKIESELRSSEEMFRMLLNGISDYAIYLLDVDGNVATWNAGAARITGYSADEIIGRHVSCFYPSIGEYNQHAQGLLAKAALTGRLEEEALRVRKDGSTFWATTVINCLYDASGKLTGYSKIMRDTTARKRADDELRKQAKLLELAHDAIIVRDEQKGIVFWNRGAEQMYGWSAEEAAGQPLHTLLKTVFPIPLETIRETLANEGQWEGELRHTTRGGTEIEVTSRMSMQRDKQGLPVATMEINRDITDRKHAEEILREKENLLSQSQRIAHIGSWTCNLADQEGRLAWSEELYRIYGVQRESFNPTLETLIQHILPEDRAAMRLWNHDCAAGKNPADLEFRVRMADDSIRYLSRRGELQYDPEKKTTRINGTTQDVTERNQVEERLALQAEQLAYSRQDLETHKLLLQSILDSVEEGLVAIDEQGKIILWNPAAKKIIGLDSGDMSPEAWGAHFPRDQNPLTRAISGEVSSAVMYLLNSSRGGGVWIETNGAPLLDQHGISRGGVVAFRDITQRKADELEIRKLNEALEDRIALRTHQFETANKELHAFTYSVSHDLRAPLRHISGFARILMNDFASGLAPEARSYLQRMQDAVIRMGLLVDGLLDLARLGRQSLKMQPNEMNAIVEQVIAVLQPECEGRDVEWRVAPLPLLDCDRILMGQVFQNLLGNALKYSRGRNKTIIEVDSIQKPGEPPVIIVRDNGAGFDMRYATKLFEVFQRMHTDSEFEGTGVGLATVHRIIQKHGGSIWAKAEIDRGATFFFTLGTSDQMRLVPSAVAAGV